MPPTLNDEAKIGRSVTLLVIALGRRRAHSPNIWQIRPSPLATRLYLRTRKDYLRRA